MRPGMLDEIVLQLTMVLPRLHLASVDATFSPEHLITRAASTGEDVETSSMLLESAFYRERMLLESACYRERTDVIFFVVLPRRILHVGATCGRGLCGDLSSPNIVRFAWYMLW